MAEVWRPILATFVTLLISPASVVTAPQATPKPDVDSRAPAAAPGADLFVEPDLIVLPTYVSGDVARLRLTVRSRSDRPLEIEEIGIRDVRFAVRVPAGWHGEGIDKVACEPPLRIEPHGELALEFEARTRSIAGRSRIGVFSKTIVAKVRGNPEPIRLADVSARIVLGYSMTPWNVDFGEVRRGEERSLEAVLETDELGPIRIVSIRPPPEIASLPFSVTAATGAEPKPSRRIVLTVKLDPSAAAGQHYDVFELETDSPQHVTIRLQVHARVLASLELRVRGVIVDLDSRLNLGVLRRGSDPVEIVVRDTKTDSNWHPGDATVKVTRKAGDASLEPKFATETAPGATDSERRILMRLLEPGPSGPLTGELRLPLHHPDLDELVLHWSAFLRDR